MKTLSLSPKFFVSLTFFYKKIISIFILLLLSFSFSNAAFYYVDSNSKDAEESISDGSISRYSSDLEMSYDTYDGRNLQIIGMRFNNVSIPIDAIITSAKIRFRADTDDSDTASLIISGELANDASSFSSDDYDLSSRTKTSASINWSPSPWTNDQYYETVDISSIVQEIVSQPGYAGDDLVIFISPGSGCSNSSCRRRADSHDASSSNAPRLEVTYELSAHATDDSLSTSPVMSISGNVLNNDSGNSIEVTSNTNPTNGTLTIQPDGSFTYTPNSGYIGNDSFTYTITDSSNNTSTATVNITVQENIRECPGIKITNLHGTTSSTTDSDNGTISNYETYYYYFTPQVAGTIQVDSWVAGYSNSLLIKDACGSTLWSDTGNSENKSSPEVNVNANQLIVVALERRYSTTQNFTIDFTYTVSTPEAIDDTATTDLNTAVLIDILANDTRVIVNTVVISSNVTHGSIVLDSTTGAVTYTPDNDYDGTDSFTYNVTDDLGNTIGATVNITVNPARTDYQTGFQPFTIVNNNAQNVVGDYRVAGNTVMCLVNKTSGYGTASDSCLDGLANQDKTSNNYVSKYIDIDGDSNTWNSTSSYIRIPNNYDISRGIIWAGLFWQGRISTATTYDQRYGKEKETTGFDLIEIGKDSNYGTLDITTTEANKIKFKINSGSYHNILANTLYNYGTSSTTYAAYADVTREVQAANLGEGEQTFTIANLTTNEGRESSPGVFGGWSLVIIYLEDLLQGQPRNISIYNGF